MGPDDLFNSSRALLARVEGEAVALQFELPERRYVTVGGSVFDCEQVTVSAMRNATGVVDPAGSAMNTLGNCPVVWNTTYEIAIVLCAAEQIQGRRGATPPPVENVEADAHSMSVATAVLTNVAETITDQTGPVTADLQFGQPQGGLIATVLTLTANAWLDDG